MTTFNLNLSLNVEGHHHSVLILQKKKKKKSQSLKIHCWKCVPQIFRRLPVLRYSYVRTEQCLYVNSMRKIQLRRQSGKLCRLNVFLFLVAFNIFYLQWYTAWSFFFYGSCIRMKSFLLVCAFLKVGNIITFIGPLSRYIIPICYSLSSFGVCPLC